MNELTPDQIDTWLEQVDKHLNQTLLACGHKPCSLGHCHGCEQHCQKSTCQDNNYLL